MRITIDGIGALFAAIAVGLGAIGAHALKGSLPPSLLQVFETGVRYQMFSALSLVLLALLAHSERVGPRESKRVAFLFVLGAVAFGGGVQMYALTAERIFAQIAPVGGFSLILGWLYLSLLLFRRPVSR